MPDEFISSVGWQVANCQLVQVQVATVSLTLFLGPQENEHTTLKANELTVLSLPSMQRAAHQQISIQSHFVLCFMFSCLFFHVYFIII